MADAKKCDRCGGFYDKVDHQNNMYILSKYSNTSLFKDCVKIVDLCPKCQWDLEFWSTHKTAYIETDEPKDFEEDIHEC